MLAEQEASSAGNAPAHSVFSENESAYSRYEIAAAWPSIVASLADCGDLQFSAAINGSVLEAGDLKADPFPLSLTYTGESDQSIPWGYQQMLDHPEFVKRTREILEDKLQTHITLSLKARAYTEEERASRRNAQMSPFEKDLEKEACLAELVKIFGGELVYSRPLGKQTDSMPLESTDELNEN